ncbi:hypothetical protein MXB_4542 [Myxobolus squamalis]|nr:hypothetical protein MXB_4542 [Myxobolus squamalis]
MNQFDISSKEVLGLVIGGFIIAFTMSIGMGANDVANAFGTTYGAKIMTILQIIIVASIFEISGAVLIGTHVSDTIRKGIINSTFIDNFYNQSKDCIMISKNYTRYTNASNMIESNTIRCPEMIQLIGSVSSLSGSSIWMVIANIFRLPVSTTHSIVGSTIGYGLVALQGNGIFWNKLIEIVISWFVSPGVSGILTILLWLSIYHLIIKKVQIVKCQLEKFIQYWIKTIIGAIMVFFIQVPFLRRKYSSITTMLSPVKADLNIDLTFNEENERPVGVNLAQQDESLSCSPSNNINNISQISQEHTIQTIENQDSKVNKMGAYMQIIIACYGSFAHGGNDVSNSVAPLISIWLIFRRNPNDELLNQDLWLIAYGAIGLVVGLALWGKRVLKTVGDDITTITPSMAYSIELGSVITVVALTRLGLPVSTTHCKIGSVILLGITRYGRGSINKKLIINILLSWLVTVPVSGLLSAALFALIQRIIFGFK